MPPFWVGFSNPERFPHSRCGYLPALETDDAPEIEHVYQEMEWSRRQYDKVQQLEAEVIHYRKLIGQYAEGLDKLLPSKKKVYKF